MKVKDFNFRKFHDDRKRFLRENSYWYKELNRNSNSFRYFVSDMKVKYKLTPEDKINRTIENIGVIQSFLDVLK